MQNESIIINKIIFFKNDDSFIYSFINRGYTEIYHNGLHI